MILLTGGSGLVGSHVLYELVRGGRQVRAIRRNPASTALVKELFVWYNKNSGEELFDRIDWVEGDVNDIMSLEHALDGVDEVYHCAAIVSFLPGDRHRMMKVNVEGTANLVNACLRAGVRKLCHCSSVAAIGPPDRGNLVDESLIWKTSGANSWYSISKYGAEREVWRGSEEGLDVVIVNPVIIIGPGDPTRSSAQLYQAVKKGLSFYTQGVTGFVDARDVALAMVFLMESDIRGERYIVSSENLSYKEVFTMFAKSAGKRPPRIHIGPVLSEIAWRLEKLRCSLSGSKPLITKETARNGQSKRYYTNDKFLRATGFQFRPVSEAIENMVAFFSAR